MYEQTLQEIETLLRDFKANTVITLDVTKITDIADHMIICSASSNQHAKTLAREVALYGKKHLKHTPYTEGDDTYDWVLIDFKSIMIHIMSADTRAYYQLEKLWR